MTAAESGSAQVTEKIEALLEPSLSAMGYDIVRVHFTGGRAATLQIMAERRDREGMTVDDCAEISRACSAILDVADPIAGAYSLEVSSPGIDRPLVRAEDFDRFAGFEARVETDRPIDGRKRFKGRLKGLTADGDVLIVEGVAEFKVPFAAVSKAKLVLTDDLIAASSDKPKQ
jgi:ribosome maturation factor RimP